MAIWFLLILAKKEIDCSKHKIVTDSYDKSLNTRKRGIKYAPLSLQTTN
ncbi:MAG: hypothetical protein GX941_03250 [Candidatus Methanofastidiosa archaeon]|nr:hypothetical protein [Candidatus Methanofastidiosa archaeon]